MIVVGVRHVPSEGIRNRSEESSGIGEIETVSVRVFSSRDLARRRTGRSWIEGVFVPVVIVDGVGASREDKVCFESFIVVKSTPTCSESEYPELTVVVEDIPIGFSHYV